MMTKEGAEECVTALKKVVPGWLSVDVEEADGDYVVIAKYKSMKCTMYNPGTAAGFMSGWSMNNNTRLMRELVE